MTLQENMTRAPVKLLTRRKFCTSVPAGVVATSIPINTADACAMLGPVADKNRAINISAPDKVDNALLVGIGVSIVSPMRKDDFVRNLTLYLTGPRPIPVATFHFLPEISRPNVKTRIRLNFADCSTKTVWTLCAHANFSDGSQIITSEEIIIKRSSNSLEMALDGGDCWY